MAPAALDCVTSVGVWPILQEIDFLFIQIGSAGLAWEDISGFDGGGAGGSAENCHRIQIGGRAQIAEGKLHRGECSYLPKVSFLLIRLRERRDLTLSECLTPNTN